jgi:hypothetical protein
MSGLCSRMTIVPAAMSPRRLSFLSKSIIRRPKEENLVYHTNEIANDGSGPAEWLTVRFDYSNFGYFFAWSLTLPNRFKHYKVAVELDEDDEYRDHRQHAVPDVLSLRASNGETRD